MDADLRLMWRSGWYIGEGLWNGQYDLTFSKGPRGAVSLATDLLVFGVIQGVFPILIGLDVVFLGLAVARHIAEGIGQMAQMLGQAVLPLLGKPGDLGRPIDLSKEMAAIREYKPFPHATMGSMWTQIGGYRIGGEGYIFGNESLPYEIGIRNTTLTDIALLVAFGMSAPEMGLTWAYVRFKALEFGVEKLAHDWSVGKYGLGINLPRTNEVGRQVNEIWKNSGRAFGAATTDLDNRLKGGWDYYGGQASGSWKHYGGQLSSAAKNYGGLASSAWKSGGARLNDVLKGAAGVGGDGGGCFLTTACVQALSLSEGDNVLSVLRAFRDQVLLKTEYGRTLVGEYYVTAPKIVASIDASPYRVSEYESIYRGLVLPTLRCIITGRLLDAVLYYESGVRQLEARWLSARTAPSTSANRIVRLSGKNTQ
jgi:hypothetical protein